LPAQNGRFVNNLVYFQRSELSTFVNVGPDTSPETFEFSNNLWYAHDEPGESGPEGLPVAESDGISAEDPELSDVGADDVAIASSSPAAGAGAPSANTAGDLLGNCFAEPPSIGAVEVE
jgi:hypothetical protein